MQGDLHVPCNGKFLTFPTAVVSETSKFAFGHIYGFCGKTMITITSVKTFV